MMMREIQLKITTTDHTRLHSNWGYALYGIISAQADSAYIADIHQRSQTPLSQYLEVLPNGTEAIWHIKLLGDEAIQKIGAVFEKNDFLEAIHHQTTIAILDKTWGAMITEREFCQQHLTDKPAKRRLTLTLLTPTGFKSQEAYQIFPTAELIIKSLWRNWQGFAREVILDGDDVREQLAQHTHISAYQLKSTYYPLKGQKIPAFKGQITLSIAGPEPLVRLVNMLLAFGEYSGLGIKTALGMGGYRLT